MVLDASAEKSIELADEIAFGTFPTDPTMEGWGGYANPASIKKTVITEDIPYLKGVSGTNRLQSTEVVKTSEAFAVDIEVRPVDWSLLPRILRGATKTTYAIGDTSYYMSFGARVGDEYETITGACFQKYECEISEDKTIIQKISALAAKVSGFTTTYIGAGAHAADPSGSVLKYGDLASVQYDSAALSTNNAYVDNIKWGVEYPVTPVKDLSSSFDSNIAGWKFGQRNITLELGLSLDEMDLAADMLAGAAHTFNYTVGGKTFTFSNIHWKGDWDQKLDADDLLGMELKADFVDIALT